MQWPKEKKRGHRMIYQTLQQTFKIEKHELHLKPGMNLGSPERVISSFTIDTI